MSDKLKERLWSFVKTFVAGFLTSLGSAILLLEPGTVSNPEFWKFAGVGTLLYSAVRSALAMAWEKAPVSFGGKK